MADRVSKKVANRVMRELAVRDASQRIALIVAILSPLLGPGVSLAEPPAGDPPKLEPASVKPDTPKPKPKRRHKSSDCRADTTSPPACENTGELVRPPVNEFSDCPECPPMVRLPGQTVAMGKYEVTVGQWTVFATVTGRSSPSDCWTFNGPVSSNEGRWSSPGFDQQSNEPVVCVSWQDATAYAEWLSAKTGKHYRLPSEDEWLMACQAGGSNLYCGSDELDAVAWFQGNSETRTHPVGQKRPNAWGLYDMSGNAWEWTDSCWEGNCDRRANRGGSWDNEPPQLVSSTHYGDGATLRLNVLGFRLAQD
ncbi:MAG: formylglycine-generating enzyme family protein [Methylococcaceae bacterium]|nr:formylglycine-generating enzyme family protein [Methylococcaceae bacterium]